jgi:hypothetical protein
MNFTPYAKRARSSAQVLAIASSAALVGCGGSDNGPDIGPVPQQAQSFAVGKATCGAGDRAETGFQGQIPMVERTAGFAGFNCNLKIASTPTSATRGPGVGYWAQSTTVRDKSGHTCIYTGGAVSFGDPPGTTVVDVTDATHAVETAVLTSPAMLGPGEGLRANEARGLLVSGYYTNAVDEAAHAFDVYDVGTDCRHPQLLATTNDIPIQTSDFKVLGGYIFQYGTTFPNPDRAYGHEGSISPDGLTYYLSDLVHGLYIAIDVSDPTHPKPISAFQNPNFGKASGTLMSGTPHNLSISNDGTRAYMASMQLDRARPDGMVPQDPNVPWYDGFITVDTSEVQARKPGAAMRMISAVSTRTSAATQMAIPFKIKGQPFVLLEGEAGAGQVSALGRQSACAAGVPSEAMAQLFYMGDETKPQLINKIILEVNDPKNCASVPEFSSPSTTFGYGVHMCSVDNRDDATTLACSYFEAGVRVYDIRDPEKIKEIAYFNPGVLPGKTPGICGTIPTLDAKAGALYSYCGNSGVFALKFENNVWPFPGSTTPADRQY